MKYIFLCLLIIPLLLFAAYIQAARFDWSLGTPTIVDDNDNTTNGVRYDWSLGLPTIVRTAPDDAPPPSTDQTEDFWDDI